MRPNLPNQRWTLADLPDAEIQSLAESLNVSPLIAQILMERGLDSPETAQIFLEPDTLELPPPIQDFPDLAISLDLISEMIETERAIAICGDYDADGMTSTALLLRALGTLGAKVDYAIPSRMSDGYGINSRLVNEFAEAEVGLIITVDNGISAHGPVEEARELGMEVIITDHHDLPEVIPPASSILNPKMAPENSPYRGMAGVGVAYMLAMHLGEHFQQGETFRLPMLELLTLGTIADLAPLTGVNRYWVLQGLHLLANSQIPGIQALVQVSGAGDKGKKSLKPDAIGFRLGPRINAVGRIGDPQLVIELLSTDDAGIALERAMQCEQINRTRQEMCEEIEREAIAWSDSLRHTLPQTRVLVPLQANWHHGVIGIVASRLVERYGVPVFICTYEDEELQQVRGSARGIPEFNVFEALNYCGDLLTKYGGHPAAGGFSLPEANLEAFRQRLSEFACQCLQPEHLKPLVRLSGELGFEELDLERFEEVEQLQPFGIGNPTPVFYSTQVRVLNQKTVGKGHLKLELAQGESEKSIGAIAWRWGEYFPLPSPVDLAYKLGENEWQGQVSLQLEVVGARRPEGVVWASTSLSPAEEEIPEATVIESTELSPANDEEAVTNAGETLQRFEYQNRVYFCGLYPHGETKELRIRNDRGQVLAVNQGSQTGLLGTSRENARYVDVRERRFYDLIKAALAVLNGSSS
ncbi:MAG: single-stranded-DNA-specific exonuclease RecJ [Phormidium sp. GEM2.Bin31]|nr:MAG: single-stranded-DNA-specific exonuclease RecJ [Phormidium sp. GEM2.Bin31]